MNYRCIPQLTLGKSPFEIVFGRKNNNFLPMLRYNKKSTCYKIIDKKIKEKLKKNAETKRHTKGHNSKIGDRFYSKQIKQNCITSFMILNRML